MKQYSIMQGIYVPANIKATRQFEKDYVDARANENRIYTDAEVAALPGIPQQHPHHKEWQSRELSARKLTTYLQGKKKPLSILEIGCGNGWLSNRLAQIKGATIMGADINLKELQQAARVFKKTPNLQFAYIDDYLQVPGNIIFDTIVFAASVQYFSSFTEIIDTCLRLLNKDGEIHIIDTHFYDKEQVASAKQRTFDYYTALGFSAMSSHYYHHTWSELANFNNNMLYNPHSLLHTLSRKKRPFPWVRIKKKLI